MMPSSLVCIDTSLAFKLIFPEADSLLARALWEEWHGRQTTVIAPPLWGCEVTVELRQRVESGLLPPDKEAAVFEALHLLPVQSIYAPGLHQRAWEIARQCEQPMGYAAYYLALADLRGCPFWTGDAQLFRVARQHFRWVCWLGNYQPSVV